MPSNRGSRSFRLLLRSIAEQPLSAHWHGRRTLLAAGGVGTLRVTVAVRALLTAGGGGTLAVAILGTTSRRALAGAAGGGAAAATLRPLTASIVPLGALLVPRVVPRIAHDFPVVCGVLIGLNRTAADVGTAR